MFDFGSKFSGGQLTPPGLPDQLSQLSMRLSETLNNNKILLIRNIAKTP